MEDKQKETVEFEQTSDAAEHDVEAAQSFNPEHIESEGEETVEATEEQQKISELESKLTENENRLLRVQADYENFKRRTREDNAAQLKYKSQSLLTQLLPALDNFERALDVKIEDPSASSVLQGVEMVYRQLLDAMKAEGLEVIESEGAAFDPHLHQAVMQVQDEQFESNVVVETLQKGYKLKDRVIRPAMVKVNQ